jgi:hypothetical protein
MQTVQPDVSHHQQQLENILEEGPPSVSQTNRQFKSKALKFCMSGLGISILVGVCVFVLLLILQPNYIFKQNKDDKYQLKTINYMRVFLISAVGALIVFLVPFVICRTTES